MGKKKVKPSPTKRGARTGTAAAMRAGGRTPNAARAEARGSGKIAHGASDGTNGGEVAWLTVVGARQNNLKNITADIPLARFVCVTGVSGSGKSSLVNDIIWQTLARDLNGAVKVHPGRHESISGLEHLDKVIDIDQSPIGRTPRSNPATYIKCFDEIRGLYARLPESKVRGYKPGRFSFNVHTGGAGGGRCESCEGNGSNKMEMELLADVWITCPVCQGKRFSRETLQIRYKGKSITDVLDMDVQEALTHFENIPKIARMLRTLHDVGLDYLKLGQSSTTLSGGEAQRIKLARELAKRSTGRTLYILDEPTTGLHFDDIKKLLAVLHGFVDASNTVLVIEHNLDVVKTADWVIDLGPEGGADGGRIVATGTPEKIARSKKSHTGTALSEILDGENRSAKTTPHDAKPAGRGKARATGDARSAKMIRVVGARQHNLKNIDVDIPRGKTTVCSGPSGSGKSSFAIDTVYTEGQRRYVESLSSYARQFLGRMQPPRVDHVYGLSPSVCIEQKNTSQSPRSTVGTVTEIYDYMRVLWARIGRPHCPACRIPVGTQDVDEIAAHVLSLPEATRALILAPIHPAGQESWGALLDRQKASGFRRVRIGGAVHTLDAPPTVDDRRDHEIELVVDRIAVQPKQRARIAESVEMALTIGDGVVLVEILPDKGEPVSKGKRRDRNASLRRYSLHRSCPTCHRAFEELTPHHFSFNARMGWCPSCEGIGTQQGAGPSTIIVHPTRGIAQGAIRGWEELAPGSTLHRFVAALADHLGLDLNTPWNELAERHQQAILQGCGNEWIELDRSGKTGRSASGDLAGMRFQWRGFFPAIARATRSSWQYRKRLQSMATDVACHACGGSRLREESANVFVGDQTIRDVCAKPLAQAFRWFDALALDPRERKIAGELLHEIRSRLRFLVDVGLDYLSLNRTASTLSGGESQRIQLAAQIGTGLTGVLYVLDEPTIGLHPRDNGRLIQALRRLRDLGNTLLLVEHDREVIDSADHVLDFGPAAGAFGGEITAAASPSRIRKLRKSLTGQYLANKASIPVPSNRRVVPKNPPRSDLEPTAEATAARGKATGLAWLTVCGARANNLKEIDAAFPLGRFTCVTGVSGSGKSSLVTEILHKALARRIHRASAVPGGHDRIVGAEHIDKVINVDQTPIGNSPTSNPATYTGLFDLVRELFAKLSTSKVRGYTAERFSFNRPGGRCEACSGMGMRCIEMHFLPDVWIECESCKGRRFLAETLDVRYHDKSIADVLEMRVSEAMELFSRIPKVHRMLTTLDDVGLGYVQLGQSAPTLSGGEAQRVKLAAELGRPSTGKTLYMLDEPTTGLHFDDLKKLLGVLHRLVDLGNTCICIEHNLDVIKTADWIIDLGPEAGGGGGEIVACGPPERIAACKRSHTGRSLALVLKAGPVQPREVYSAGDRPPCESVSAGKLDLGDDVKMPWEQNGRSWHTVDHTDSQGRAVAWDSQLLAWLVEAIESLGTLLPTDWNHRTRVEITAAKSKQWFAHFLTGGKDLLEVALRVPEGSFTTAGLSKRLGIKTLDERSDLPLYGQWSRARVRPVGNGWSAIRLTLRDFKDVKKTAFRSFLRDAHQAYRQSLDSAASDPTQGKPWKQDGRGWHLGQKCARRRHVLKWRPELILTVIGKLKAIEPGLTVDWNQESAILFSIPGEPKIAGKIVTNLGRGLRLELRAPAGAITPAMIDRLGDESEIRRRGSAFWVTFWIRTITQTDWKQFRDVWRKCRVTDDTERLQSA